MRRVDGLGDHLRERERAALLDEQRRLRPPAEADADGKSRAQLHPPQPPIMLFRVVEVNQSFYEDMITDWQFKQDLPVYKKPLTKNLPNI